MTLEIFFENMHPRLEEILQSINRPGNFVSHGRIVVPMPRLEVENFGVLSFPVPEIQIEELVRTADRAPYGRGTQTLVDVTVRNCWEINSDQISLGGRSWDRTIRKLESLAADGLGCPQGRLSASLYKLLIYSTGGFFIPHRDTEKADGMIATLTVSLPVEGTGGELVVRHKDAEVTIEMNVDDPSELAYAAFYADCEHEIKKVRSGHRIALVFNLCLEPDDFDTIRTAPDYSKEVDEIAKELQIWCDSGENSQIVWILEHQYSEAGLSFDTLKNGDRAIAGALHLASERAECELYASIVHIEESFGAYYEDDYYYSDSPSDLVIVDMDERRTWMDGWVSPEGRHPKFGDVSFEEGELMPADALEDALPDEERVSEATGNSGATLDRAYHFAALVLFRRAGVLDNLVKQSTDSAVGWIAEELARNNGIVDDYIIELTENLIDLWPETVSFWNSSFTEETLGFLLNLSDTRISRRFLREIAVRDYKGRENDGLAKLLSTVRPADAGEIMRALICGKFPKYPENILQLTVSLARQIENYTHGRRHVFRVCAAEIVRMLPQALTEIKKESESRYQTKKIMFAKDDTKNLFSIFWHGDALDSALSVAEILEKFPATASLDREVPKALFELREISEFYHSQAYSSLWCISANYLLERSCVPPEKPKNWKIRASESCDCHACDILRKFCENPEQHVARIKVNKRLRSHLRYEVKKNQLDVSYETERRGSPYTFVCIKNRESYQRRLEEYAEDIDYMELLIDVIAGAKSSGRVSEKYSRLCAAVEHEHAPHLK